MYSDLSNGYEYNEWPFECKTQLLAKDINVEFLSSDKSK
jgi:hypothetical protein